MFPDDRRNGLMNYLYVVAKYFVYANKLTGRELNLESLLKRKFQSDRYIANLNNTFAKCFIRWSVLYNYLNQND